MSYNLPALYMLAKKDPDAALAVFYRLRDESCNYGAEPEPAYLDPRERSSDDMEAHAVPDEPLTSETMTESVSDGPDEVYAEMLHEVKPDLHVMLRSAGGSAWPWCGVRVKKDGKWCWIGEPWAYMFCLLPHLSEKHVTTLGGLTFYTKPASPENRVRRGHQGGMLVSYIDDAGHVQRPAYKASKPRGGKRPYRSDATGYLALPGAVDQPGTATGVCTPLSGEAILMPMLTPQSRRAPYTSLDIAGQIDRVGRYGVGESRAELKALGVDGSVAFERLPFPATRCPTVVLDGAQFMGGISGRSQTASSGQIGKPREPAAPLSPALELLASRSDLTAIGEQLGDKDVARPDRQGMKHVLREARMLVAANDNNECRKNAA